MRSPALKMKVSPRRGLHANRDSSLLEFRGFASNLLEAQEQERRRVSQELHDDLGQRLALLGMQIDKLERKAPSSEVADGLKFLRDRVGEIAGDVHRICYRLHPIILENLGLAAALESFCKEYAQWSGISTRFVQERVPVHLPPNISLCLYRVVQEALHNVAKHSKALNVVVVLRGTLDDIEVIVADSGRGFDRAAVRAKNGIGLISIEERVRLGGGRCTIQSSLGCGTEVRAMLPLRYKLRAG